MPPITTYPLPVPLPAGAIEMPSWWTFAGRWGVRVNRLAAGQWDSGTRRTDPFGRTRAYLECLPAGAIHRGQWWHVVAVDILAPAVTRE